MRPCNAFPTKEKVEAASEPAMFEESSSIYTYNTLRVINHHNTPCEDFYPDFVSSFLAWASALAFAVPSRYLALFSSMYRFVLAIPAVRGPLRL